LLVDDLNKTIGVRLTAGHSQVRGDLGPFAAGSDPGGWWILTEISVAYEPHECPSHDLAG
jgi:hypothetical protein